MADLKKLLRTKSIITITKTLAEAKATGNRIGILKQTKALIELLGQSVDASQLYSADDRRTPTQRQKDNDIAVSLSKELIAQDKKPTLEQKITLAKYSGSGGNLVSEDGSTGSPYEYYTPKAVAQGMWDLMAEMGFTGGRVLDPSAGTGIFAATRPDSVLIEQVELSETSGQINGLINNSDTCSTIISPFEAVAAGSDDEIYDAIVTNVPFGQNINRTAKDLDEKFRSESLEAYFLLRSLQKLKSGGLACFIVPPRVVSNISGKWQSIRQELSMMAEFMGGYRLPNSVFAKSTNADTITDVIVFKKHPKSLLSKLDDIQTNSPEALRQSNLLWEQFLAGKYFDKDGKRYVLGEFQAKDPSKYKDVDRVINNDSTANIAKLMRKFGGSRIDWELLDSANAEPIAYKAGDTLTKDGATLKFDGTTWQVIENKSIDNSALQQIGINVTTALSAVTNGVTYQQAADFLAYSRDRSLYQGLSGWFKFVMKESTAESWLAIVTGFAIGEALDHHRPNGAFNYAEAYAALTKAIPEAYKGKSVSGVDAKIKQKLELLPAVYSREKGFSKEWNGENVSQDQGALTPSQLYAKLRFEYAGADYIPLSLMTAEGFDPFNDDDWCVSPDGTGVISADDYYQGNLADFLTAQRESLSVATDPAVKAKISQQMSIAEGRVIKPAIDHMTFNIDSPFVSKVKKLEFLRQTVNEAFYLEINDEGEYEFKLPKDVRGSDEGVRQLRRLLPWLNGGNLTTFSKQADIDAKPELEVARVATLKNYALEINANFSIYAKTNPLVYDELKARLHNPENLFFKLVDNESPLDIVGMHPDHVPHGYQYAEIYRQSRRFGGINAMQVGLGKTSTALLSVQYAQSINLKKKTVFIVPKSLLPNWYREAAETRGTKGEANYKPSVLASVDDCLFVGMRKGKVQPNQFVADLNLIMEHQHKKIFMTAEAFQQIPLRDRTLTRYKAALKNVDSGFDTSSNKKSDILAAESRANDAVSEIEGKLSVPYFEDMRIDSLVFDEIHSYKNSKRAVRFKAAKFLSLPDPSARGADAQVKSWYIRDKHGDGVLGLTATPITNSPIEVYSMLSMTVGEESVSRYLGGIRGTDEFLSAFCQVAEISEPDVTGRLRVGRTFMGLDNLSVVRAAFSQQVNVKTPEDVGASVKLPDPSDVVIGVALDETALGSLKDMKDAYILCKEYAKDRDRVSRDIEMELQRVEAQYGVSSELLAHPFHLINKMERLILAPSLVYEVTEILFAQDQLDVAQAVVDEFNKKGFKEVVDRAGPMTLASDITEKKTKNKDGVEKLQYEVIVRATIDQAASKIVVNTDSYDIQGKFLKIANKAKLAMDVEISPKIAAFLENVKKENANPKYGAFSKQIVFCDMLAMHNLLTILLVKYAGISKSKIAIINASAASPEDIQDIQDGFNANDEDNQFSFIIANEKAEVGINLQNNTQAVHHLTIGWTPDSITQRNGRAVRQGNKLDTVTVYSYDAAGTFDEYKRNLVSRKADWIGSVLDGDMENIQIAGDLTDAEKHDLIMASGDSVTAERIRAEQESREVKRQADNAKNKQWAVSGTITNNVKWLKNNSSSAAYINKLTVEKQMMTETWRETLIKMEWATSDESKARLKAIADGLLLKINEINNKTDEKKQADYDAEVAWRKAAIEQASADFKRITIGYPAEVASQLISGEAWFVGTQLFAPGMVAELPRGRLCVIGGYNGSNAFAKKSPHDVFEGINLNKKAVDFVPLGASDAGYSEIIAKMAAMDDELITANPDIMQTSYTQRRGLFSYYVADVDKALTVKREQPYMSMELNSPLFRLPIHPSNAVKYPFLSFIINQQAPLIEFSQRGDMVKPKNGFTGYREGGMVYSSSSHLADAVGYCIANGVIFKSGELNAGVALLGSQITDEFEEHSGCFTEANARIKAEAKTVADADRIITEVIEQKAKFIDKGAIAELLPLFKEKSLLSTEIKRLKFAEEFILATVLLKDPAALEVYSKFLLDTAMKTATAVSDAKDLAYKAMRTAVGQSFNQELGRAMIDAYQGELPSKNLKVSQDEELPKDLFLEKHLDELNDYIDSLKRAAAEATGNKDVSAYIKALNFSYDIDRMTIMPKSYVITTDSGDTIDIKAGEFLIVETAFGSKSAKRIQDDAGKRRVFINKKTDRQSVSAGVSPSTKGWLFAIGNNVTTSRGVPVMSIDDALKYYQVELGE